MSEVGRFLEVAAGRCGFVRERHSEAKLPTSAENVVVLPFFGDMRSHFVLSSLLLHRFIETFRPSAYVVVASHPGFGGLYPDADEYWGVRDRSLAADLWDRAGSFRNIDPRIDSLLVPFNQNFRDCLSWERDLAKYYRGGLTKEFLEAFRDPVVRLPLVRPLPLEASRKLQGIGGHKVFIHPSRTFRLDVHRQVVPRRVGKEFWVSLAKGLADRGVTPIVWQNSAAYDISPDLAERAVYVDREDVSDAMAAMRACGCVLDVGNGLNWLAAAARCPFYCVEDRQKYADQRDAELSDLCVISPHRKWHFMFLTQLDGGRHDGLAAAVAAGAAGVLPGADRDTWPAAADTRVTVPYSKVRLRKNKRVGTRFVRVPRLEEFR